MKKETKLIKGKEVLSQYHKVILTDADGVLLNWGYAFDVWMTEKGYTAQDKLEYNVAKIYGITQAESKKLVREFNESAHMGFVPPLRDAIQYVRKLHEEHGYVFHLITSMSKDENAQKLRTMNIQKLFGDEVTPDHRWSGLDLTTALQRLCVLGREGGSCQNPSR